jgi:hypothetical protein
MVGAGDSNRASQRELRKVVAVQAGYVLVIGTSESLPGLHHRVPFATSLISVRAGHFVPTQPR